MIVLTLEYCVLQLLKVQYVVWKEISIRSERHLLTVFLFFYLFIYLLHKQTKTLFLLLNWLNKQTELTLTDNFILFCLLGTILSYENTLLIQL